MQEAPDNPFVKEVPGHLFKFEEKIWGMTLQQLLTDLGALTGSITLTGSLPLIARVVVCVLLTLLAVILVHGKAQGHPLGFWLYLRIRFQMMPRRTTWQSIRGDGSSASTEQEKRAPSVQASWVPVESCEHGIMGKCEQHKKTAVARYWVVFEAEGRNVRLLPEQEQVRVFQRFETFLTGLEFHLQFLSYTEQIDPRMAPALLAQQEALTSLTATPRLHALQRASLRVQAQHMTTCTRTRHFVVVSASGAETALQHPDGTPRSVFSLIGQLFTFKQPPVVSRTHILDQLRIRATRVKKAIQQLDMRIWQLEDPELLQLLARCLAPGASVPTFVPELIKEPADNGLQQHCQRMAQHAVPARGNVAQTLPQADAMAKIPGYGTQPRYDKRISGLHRAFWYQSTHAQARLEAGVIEVADLIAPSCVAIQPDIIEIQAGTHMRYARTFTITGYGHHLSCGWVSELSDLGLPMLISSHFEPIDSRLMIMKLEQHLTKLESQRLADQKTLRITHADQHIEAEQIRRVSRALASKRLKIFDVSMTICLHAGSLERLEQRTHYLLSHLHDLHLQVRPALQQQDLAWQSCLPTNLDLLQHWSKLPSDVASTFLPGTSGVVGTPTGAFLGDTGSGFARRPVYFNPWSAEKKIPNPHVVGIGESGMGKSWLGKTMVTGFLGLGLADVVVLDKDDDYLALHEALI